MPYKSEADRCAAARRYATSDKGRKKRSAWSKTEIGKINQRRRNSNEAGKARRERFEATEDRKLYRRAWQWRSRKASRSGMSIKQALVVLRDLGKIRQ